MITYTGHLHRLLFPTMIWTMPGPKVFLTFDDGPHPTATPAVLDTLARHGVTATFFLSGQHIAGREAIVERIHREGHSIGIHAYHHNRSMAFSYRATSDEILRTQELLHSIIGSAPRLFRPPFGFFSWNTIRAAREHGVLLVMWSCLTGDYSSLSDDKVVKNAVTRLQRGSILVFHDNDLTEHRITRLLDSVIPEIKRQGYSFGAIR